MMSETTNLHSSKNKGPHRYKCLIKIDGQFYSIWENINLIVQTSLFITIPVIFAFQKLAWVRLPFKTYFDWVNSFFILDMIYNCLV